MLRRSIRQLIVRSTALLAVPLVAVAQNTSLVSANSSGIVSDKLSDSPSLSADGRYVAFASDGTNLVTGDANGAADIFLRDMQSGTTVRLSVSSIGAPANGGSFRPSISADGNSVAFETAAINLVPGGSGFLSIVVRDQSGLATLVASASAAGIPANNHCFEADISGNGRYVAFASEATNLVSADGNGKADVFVKDLQTGAISIESVSSFGLPGNELSASGKLSGDGRYVAFISNAVTLVVGDTNSVTDIFRRDRQLGQTIRVSVSAANVQADGESDTPSISADGSRIAFASNASNLAFGDTNGIPDIFVRDAQLSQTTRVSVGSAGEQSNGFCWQPVISRDGRHVAFQSDANNLVSNDTNGQADVFVHDLTTGKTIRASVATLSTQLGFYAQNPALSADGRFVAFSSPGPFVGTDGNGILDVYLRDTLVPWSDLGNGLVGSSGVPLLTGSGTALGGSVVTLSLEDAKPLATTSLVVGFGVLNAPFKGGVLVPTVNLLFAIPTDAAGQIIFPALWPTGVPSNSTLHFQYWISDAAGPKGFAASNGLKLTTP